MQNRSTTIATALIAALIAATAAAGPATAAAYTFTQLTVPAGAVVNGINDVGQIVGSTASGAQPFVETLSTGAVTIFPQIGFSTSGTAINNNGLIAGSIGHSGYQDQFILDTKTGNVTTFSNFRGFIQSSNAAGINDAGLIVGSYTGSYHAGVAGRSYLLDTTTGTLTRFADPATGPSDGYLLSNPLLLGYTDAADINNTGQVVGATLLHTVDNPQLPAGFIYDEATGTFSHLTFPGASSTAASGINDKGQIVGRYTLNGTASSFVYDETTGLYTTVTDPDGAITAIAGINNAGQIVGQYTDSTGTTRNFLATPTATTPPTGIPEPASLALLTLPIAAAIRARPRTPKTP